MITGDCDPRFFSVRDQLSASLDAGDDLGAGVALFVSGQCVVDLRGGFRDRKKTAPFDDALVCVYSVGKAVLSALVMQAVSTGGLRYDQPIADIWPEFAAHGKSDLTVASALSHQTGLSAFMEPIDPALWLDWDGICAAIAAERPLWPLGDGCGYHPQTYGFIVGEVLRRVTGQSVGEQLRDIGLDIHCGISGDLSARIGPMVKPPAAPDLGPLTPIKRAAFLEKWSATGAPRDQWAAAEIPASNMHASARSLAQLMQSFTSGVGWGGSDIDPETRRLALSEQVRADDRVLPFNLSWGMGVMRNIADHYGPSPSAIGHYGFGGACVMADPENGIAFAYTPNKMSNALVRDPRAIKLIDAVYASI